MIFHGIDIMKNTFTYLLAAAMLVCSCLEENPYGTSSPISGAGTEGGELTFSLLAAPYTRAVADQENMTVEWSAGDRISILDGTGNQTFETVEGGALGKFSGTAEAADAYYAVYPYTEGLTLSSDGVLALDFPSQQTESAGQIPDPSASVWAGRSRGSLIVMNNFCATVAFSFNSTDIASVVIRGIAGENVAGPVYLSFDEEDKPFMTLSQLTASEITLLPSSGETFAPGRHAVTLLPENFSEGLSLSFVRTGEGGTTVKKINTVSSLAPSAFIDLGTFDLDAPELISISADDAEAGGSGALLKGTMEVLRFHADKVNCGFEYRLSEEDDWTSVTCATSAESFSYTLKGLAYTENPVSYRAWAEIDSYIVRSEEKSFTMLPPYVMSISFVDPESEYKNIGAQLVEWEFKTQRKMPPAEYNGKEYIYTAEDGNAFSFSFWCRPDHEGFCIRAITNDKETSTKYYTYHGICMDYTSTKDVYDIYHSWVLLPSMENARLIKAEIQMYDKNSILTLSSSIGEDGIPEESAVIASATSENKYYGYMTFELPDSEPGKRYYLSAAKKPRMTITGMNLTFQYE